MFRKYTLYILILCLAIPLSVVPASKQQELKQLREEIEQVEHRLHQSQSNESVTLELINKLDREIDATKSYIGTLAQEIRKRDQEISKYNREIALLDQDLSALKSLIKKRLVTFYKKGRYQRVELLLQSRSLDQVETWVTYQKMVIENDLRNIESLREKKATLERKKELLRMEIAERERKIRSHSREETRLQSSQRKRRELLASIRNSQEVLKQHLEQTRSAEKRILSHIANAEKDRLGRRSEPVPSSQREEREYPFRSLKGRLMWPVQGNIINHFGRQKHPQLNTITENLGIEIKAAAGTPVRAVDKGYVQTITWQRGRGNIIILSHDNGYYTVYTNLREILVKLNQQVESGQSIGRVGESGSLKGPVLHFQIWKNTSNLNPEEWLS
jgi:septal ring factor EnvC (AmiA/AmiB activator)